MGDVLIGPNHKFPIPKGHKFEHFESLYWGLNVLISNKKVSARNMIIPIWVPGYVNISQNFTVAYRGIPKEK